MCAFRSSSGHAPSVRFWVCVQWDPGWFKGMYQTRDDGPQGPPAECQGGAFSTSRFPVHGHQRNPQALYPVVVLWKHLAHPNIVSLLGVTLDPLQFVLDWISGGDLTGYITNNPDADRLCLVRVSCTLCCVVRHAYLCSRYPMSLKASTSSTPTT